jgi:putative peptide zinc metalloprotease protein
MRFGPTSLKASSILAKGLRRPKLRADLRISEQVVAGARTYVVNNPETNSYNRYGAMEFELLNLCDGTRTHAEVAAAWNERHPDQMLPESEVFEYLDGVESEMWERTTGQKNLAVLERIRDERKSRVDQSSMLYISFKAWDPNKTLAAIEPYLRWIYTPGFIVFSLIVFTVGAYLVAGDWAQVQRDTASLYSFHDKSAYDIWMFWILLFVLGGIHEFGHGLTCKHFGGEVHQMGFLLIYLTPAFFTDTTDMMLFERTSRRQWVLLAGIWIELVVCGLSAFFWRFTAPGSFANDIAYKMLLLSGVQGTLLNLNPLIKADGYYMLSEYLQIDCLREDSFVFLRALARKYILREDIDLPPATRRQRRIFFIFSVIAMIYGVGIILLVTLFVRNVFVSKFGFGWGYACTLALVLYFSRKGLRNGWRQTRAWWREKKEQYMAWKMSRPQQWGAVALAAVLLIPPIPTKVASDFVLDPGREAHVRTQVPGVVTRVFVRPGDTVKSGQILAALSNPDIESNAQIVSQRLNLANSNVRVAQASADPSRAAAAIREQQGITAEWQIAEAKHDALEIRAPFDGIVETSMAQKLGLYLASGDEVCQVVDRSSMKARILVRDWELEDVKQGATASLKVVPYALRTYDGRVDAILPAAAMDRPVGRPQQMERMGQELTNYFAVVMVFPNPDGSLTEGMTGTAKISGRSYPLAWSAGRDAWRWVRSQVW